MTIRYDRTRWATVVVCTDCGWQDLGVTKQAAYSLAADHERRAHPEQDTVRNAARHRQNYRGKSTELEG
jgi:hypothetical protein